MLETTHVLSVGINGWEIACIHSNSRCGTLHKLKIDDMRIQWDLSISLQFGREHISYATRHTVTYCCAFECAVDHFLHFISNGYQFSTYLLLQFLQLCWKQLCFATGLGRRNRGCWVACPRKPARNCFGKSSKDCQCEENSEYKLLCHSCLHVDTFWRRQLW